MSASSQLSRCPDVTLCVLLSDVNCLADIETRKDYTSRHSEDEPVLGPSNAAAVSTGRCLKSRPEGGYLDMCLFPWPHGNSKMVLMRGRGGGRSGEGAVCKRRELG